MKKIYALFLTVAVLNVAHAQNTFQALYGSTNSFFANGSRASAVVQTPDGGYVTAGHTDDYASNGDLFLLKTDAAGGVLWYRNFAVNDPDRKSTEVSALEKTADGGFIIAGKTYGVFGNDDMLVMKTDSLGALQWYKVFGAGGSSAAKAVKQTPSGDYIVLGAADDAGIATPFYASLYALKLSSGGDSLWTKTYSFPGSRATAADVQVTGDGNFVLGGTFQTLVDSSAADRAPVLIKVNAANGNIIWSKTFGSATLNPVNEVMNDFVIAPDGGFVMAGTAAINYGYNDAWMMKTDAGGNNILWSKRYSTTDTSESEDFNAIAAMPGGFVLYGDMFSFATSKQFAFSAATDNDGNISWANRVGNGNFNYGYSVVPTQDNGFLFGGYEVADFSFQSTTAYVLKADAGGSTGCYESPLTLGVNNVAVSITAGPLAYGAGGGIGGETIASYDAAIPVTVLCQNPAPQLLFTTFKGDKGSSENKLTWRTKSELKSDKYYVQRSINKTTITTLGEVDATYKTLSNNPYNFTDTKPARGANYYRVKAVSNNGHITYSKVVTISNGNAVTVSNTTTPGEVLFRSEEPYDAPYLAYTIYSAMGNKVFAGTVASSHGAILSTVSLSSLKDGIYYVHLNMGDDAAAQQIIIRH